VLSAIVVVASSAVAFAVAGGLSLVAAAIAWSTPLRAYAAREEVEASEAPALDSSA
jgi:hypothetical protein